MPITTRKLAEDKDWVDLICPDKGELQKIINQYSLDEYQVLNWMKPDQLPSYEKVGESHFIMGRLFTVDIHQHHLHTLHELTDRIAIFFNPNFIVTIHRDPFSFIDDTIAREKFSNGSASTSADVLALIFLHILKTYENAAFKLSEHIDQYEDTILLKTLKSSMLKGLYFLKRKAGIGKRLIILTGEIISFINTLKVDENTARDIADLQLKLVTWFDQVLDDVVNLLNTYLTLSAHKTNDVMKILTIFSVFFMPLTFIVGVYGMNFKYMPELTKSWGYPGVMILMGIITIGIFIWFKRKKWL